MVQAQFSLDESLWAFVQRSRQYGFQNQDELIQVVPITEWNEKKARISTNIDLERSAMNGLPQHKNIFTLLHHYPKAVLKNQSFVENCGERSEF